jgi:hypothetical protein
MTPSKRHKTTETDDSLSHGLAEQIRQQENACAISFLPILAVER